MPRAFRWLKLLDEGEQATLEDLANAKGMNTTYVSHIFRLTLLVPDLVEAILDGRQPATCSWMICLSGFGLSKPRQKSATGRQADVGGRTTAL